MTLDSTNQTWTSIGGEHIQIEYMLPVGQQKNSTRFPSTLAELISKSEVNGRLQLVSLLTVTVPENATDQIYSVTCSNMMGDATTISFQVAAGINLNGIYTRSHDNNMLIYSCIITFTISKSNSVSDYGEVP